MDIQELRIAKIAAVNPGSYFHSFVYVETLADEPSGLYPNKGSDYEEYAIWRGHRITRAEYDDGAAEIDGKIVQLGGQAQLRCRYLRPYNLVIAAQNSPINNGEFDDILVQALDTALLNENAVTELSAEIRKLPKPRW